MEENKIVKEYYAKREEKDIIEELKKEELEQKQEELDKKLKAKARREVEKKKATDPKYQNRIKTLKRRKFIAVLIVGGAITLGAISSIIHYYKNDRKVINRLEKEISIHAGYQEVDGHKVYPQYSHGKKAFCDLGDPKEYTVKERIALYCDENNIQDVTEDAIRKYEALYEQYVDDERKHKIKKEINKEIDLYEIHKNNLENSTSLGK